VVRVVRGKLIIILIILINDQIYFNLWNFDCFMIKINITMKNRYFVTFFSLFFIFGVNLLAQNRDFQPFVSDIKIETRNNLIRITWIDSPDARGPVHIYKSARPFGGTIPANIRPVAVRYGEQYYVDDSDDMENLYYFIAASDVSGRRYDLILPQINSISLIPEAETAPPVILSSPELMLSADFEGIYNLRAYHDGERVIITFDTTEDEKNAILYRSTQPINRPQDLLNAVIVQSMTSSPFTDSPVPGLTWYYAVIYEDEISSGNVSVRPGVNATISAVTIFGDQSQERSLRPIPLPMLTLNNTMPEGFFITEIPRQIPLSIESANMLRDTKMPLKSPLVLKNPRVFSVDLAAPTGGEDSALFQIVMERFVKFEWESARISLEHYLSLPRSRDIETRARFYLGQTFYYTGSFREALMEFLKFRSFHPAEANSWIEAVLTAMVY